MIGATAEYCSLVASVMPMSWESIADDLPLCIGMQLRNIALAEGGVKIIPPGRHAFARAKEILGEEGFREWMAES